MFHFNITGGKIDYKPDHAAETKTSLYTREAFRTLLARQPEWKIRAALEEGNIPRSNIEHAVEWLQEQEQERQRPGEHHGYWM
jgi:hypothetical protein